MIRNFFQFPRSARKLRMAFLQRASVSSEASHLDWNTREDFFSYTRGRFVRNEQYELSQRYVRFDINELARIACESVGSECCVSVEKFPDGMHNKAFLFTMQDGKQVVGKVPNPYAGRPHYTTASEVATMDFAKNILGTTVPKVLAWSSKADENSVGAEYIIMEKVPGVQLDHVWSRMRIEERFEVLKAIARYQKAWMSISFSQYGSLYYSRDLKNSEGFRYLKGDGTEVSDSRFAVGPSTGREFFDDGRAAFDFDRGPWNTPEDYKRAIGHREIECVKKAVNLPRSPVTLCGPGTYVPSRSKKTRALQCYLELVKYLLPTDTSILASSLSHGDLHAENIFVHPDKPSQVLGIIDWQSTQLLPLFDQARQPYFLDYNGPRVTGLGPPQFPDNFDQLDPTERKKAESLYLNMSLSALYRTLVHGTNKTFYRAMEFRETTGFDMMLLAQNLFIDGETLYLSRVVELEQEWQSLPEIQARGNPAFPFHFSHQELATINEDVAGAIRGMECMEDLRTALGDLWPEKGIVRHDQYNDVKVALRDAKKQTIDMFARTDDDRKTWETLWPFDD